MREAPMAASLRFVRGEAKFTLGEDVQEVKTGAFVAHAAAIATRDTLTHAHGYASDGVQVGSGAKAAMVWERPAKCSLFGMRLTYILALTASILALAGAGAGRPVETRAGAPDARSLVGKEIEDSTKTGAVGPGATGPRVVRAQILLDRARFSPGEIDGVYGESFGIAVKGYQENHGLKPTGTIDVEVWRLLNRDAGPLLLTYTITQADEKGPFQPVPADTQEKAKMKWLGFETPEEELGERFHSSPKLLAELNPGKKLDTVGERITVPNVRRTAVRLASRLVVSESKRTVIAYGAGDKELARYPATLGSMHDPLPIGHWTIKGVVHNPWFNYDPERFWNADPKKAKAILPPGPNNPAGVAWLGLSKENFGIHGTPDPGNIRHTESAGCIRLTNWDVEELSHMVRRGTPVVLEE
jgi:lipoprotein-anchoring transpeptidase ErfK/SrfK